MINDEPRNINAIYVHYKNKPYKLIDFSLRDESSEKEEHVLYKPLYEPEDFPKNTLWLRPLEMFFENINLNEETIPRFKYIGRGRKEVLENLQNLNINQDLNFNYCLERKRNLILGLYSVQGYALHSETLEEHILYYKTGIKKMMFQPRQKFMKKLGINNKNIRIYLEELKQNQK